MVFKITIIKLIVFAFLVYLMYYIFNSDEYEHTHNHGKTLGYKNSTMEVGCSGIGSLYKFTNLPAVAEEAQVMKDMGALVHKYKLDPYHGQTLLQFFLNDESSKYIDSLKFNTLVMWSMPNTGIGGLGGMFNPSSYKQNYDELYELTLYLRKTYHGTGRRFFLGNWESDNSLYGYCNTGHSNEPPPVPWTNLIDYFNIRQKAVNDARNETQGSDVQVFHYAEVNCVQAAMAGYDRVINKVIPFTNPKPDFISYSSYDSLWPDPVLKMLPPALEYLSGFLPKQPDGTPSVIVGEFGFKQKDYGEQGVSDQTERVLQACKDANIPISLFWATYNNEPGNFYQLIDSNNKKMMVYFTMKKWMTTSKM